MGFDRYDVVGVGFALHVLQINPFREQARDERSTIVVTAKCNQFMQKAVPSFILRLPFSQFKPKAYFLTTASFLMLIISGKFKATLRLKVAAKFVYYRNAFKN